jgi:UDP-N-acetylmuramoyl-tripeptide--D-alanyl-D-alanine ligase
MKNRLTFADVIEALTGVRPSWATQEITDAVIDSRQATPGGLFVALPGENVDGHDYVADAFERGARFAFIDQDIDYAAPVLDLREGPVIAEIPSLHIPCVIRVSDSLQALQQVARFWRQQLELQVIGITGSVGKSTTKELVAAVLGQNRPTLKNIGNLNNEIGLPLTILGIHRDHRYAVLEMGFYIPGEIKFLCEIAQPHIGVITNIGTVHAERAGSQEAIAHGKSELVQALPSEPEGVAILNYDDPWVRAMAAKTKAKVFFYGLDANADLWADQVEGLGLDGIRFRLHYGNEILYLRVPLIGRHSVHTALRAAAVGLVVGLTWEEIITGLRTEQTQLRLVAVRSKCGALLLDDTYNASPQSTLAALNLLAEMAGRKIAVLGDMLELGQYEQLGHEKVGGRAAEVADEVITVGERAHIIAKAARVNGFPSQHLTEFANSTQVISYLEDYLKPNDVVLVKGSRGMSMDQIIANLEARQ